MRVYLPTTLASLAAAYIAGGFDGGHAAHAVTPAIREWYVGGDEEELEYAALSEAADASLALLAADLPAQARYEHRRVVVAADVEDAFVTPDAGTGYRSGVLLSCRVPLPAIASVHVDEDDDAVRRAVAAAQGALVAAAAGDDDAAFVLDEARSHELLWFDASEIPDLV